MAQTSKALIYGFNVDVPKSSKQQANRDKVVIRTFNIIYELINDVKAEMSLLLKPEIVENKLGTLIVKGIFKTTKTEVICGGEVMVGKLQLPAIARVMRGKEELAEAEVVSLKKGSDDAKEVIVGEMCGLSLKTDKRLEVLEGDKITLFNRESISRTI